MMFWLTDELIPPLGGQGLKPLMAQPEERADIMNRVADWPRVEISDRARGDLAMLAIGGFTPLGGFMNRAAWLSVCRDMTLPDGIFWPMPIVLDADGEALAGVDGHALLIHAGQPVAIVEEAETWQMSDEDLRFECEAIFRGQGSDSEDFWQNAPERHPGVKSVLARRKHCLAGQVTVLADTPAAKGFTSDFIMTPMELRQLAQERGWKEITALQLRNPPHRSHEYLARIGLETADAVLIHTPTGELKAGDLPADTRLRCIRALIDKYLPAERTLLAGYPLDMRYAGPREALLHAAFRQNFGVTTQIVGRDHAGVGDFYAPFEAQEIFLKLPRNNDPLKNLLTRPLKIKWPFYCRVCDSIASLNTCPHGAEDRVFHSGSLLRKCFAENQLPPEGFIRREVFEILAEHYRSAHSPAEQIVLYGAADGSSLKPVK